MWTEMLISESRQEVQVCVWCYYCFCSSPPSIVSPLAFFHLSALFHSSPLQPHQCSVNLKLLSQTAQSVCFGGGGAGLHYVEPNLIIPMIVVTLAIRFLIEMRRKGRTLSCINDNETCCAVQSNSFVCIQVKILGAILFITTLLYSISLDSVMKACCTWVVLIQSVEWSVRARVHVFAWASAHAIFILLISLFWSCFILFYFLF